MSTKAHKSFERTLERVDAMLEAHKIVTRQQGRPPRFLSDILRSTIILIIASLDSYLHDVIQERVYHYVSIRKGKNLHKKLLKPSRMRFHTRKYLGYGFLLDRQFI